jgi:monomeric isocitrate dehydrogenase
MLLCLLIRTSGQMWNADNKLQDTIALIPDRCYSGVYETTIDFCKERRLTQQQWEVFQTQWV